MDNRNETTTAIFLRVDNATATALKQIADREMRALDPQCAFLLRDLVQRTATPRKES